MERRNFLKKLFAGTTVIGTAGIFSLKKDIVLANELDLNEVKKYNEEDLIRLANDMFDAMDGKLTHGPIYDFVQGHLRDKGVMSN